MLNLQIWTPKETCTYSAIHTMEYPRRSQIVPTEVHGHVNQQSRVKDKNLGAILENVVPLFVLLAQFHTLQYLVQLFPELLRPHLYKKVSLHKL